MTETPEALHIEQVGSEHAEALAALFERSDCPCYCRYWDFPGDARQWQDRCANSREVSRAELLEALTAAESSGGELLGLVALAADGSCVGWMRLARPDRMGKLYDGRLYRGLPCLAGERRDILTVACFLVDEAWRRRGVARRLLERALDVATAAGARALEAFPRRAEGVSDAEHWMGPPTLYEELGFTVLHELGPYPVMRREL